MTTDIITAIAAVRVEAPADADLQIARLVLLELTNGTLVHEGSAQRIAPRMAVLTGDAIPALYPVLAAELTREAVAVAYVLPALLANLKTAEVAA